MVGARGFEPPTSRSQTERTTRLCYAPKVDAFYEATVRWSSLDRIHRMFQDLQDFRNSFVFINARARWLMLFFRLSANSAKV